MRSTKVTFRVDNQLLEMFLEDCHDKSMENLGNWFKSLGIDRVMLKRRMALYEFIAKAPPKVQDAMIAVMQAFPEDPAEMAQMLVDRKSPARTKVERRQAKVCRVLAE